MRITLVHNPGAGDDGNPQAAELQQLIRSAGHEVICVSCEQEDWTEGLGLDSDLVAVAGGDGTVGRAAKALVGRNVPFTAIPMGTANNISRTLGLVEKPVPELIASWQHSRSVAFDVGIARGPWGERYFLEGCGAGLFACTMPEADASATLEHLPRAEARVAYALQMLRERIDDCAVQALQLRLDGRELSGEYVLAEAMNMEYVGPNLYLAPACDLHDGLLDVVLVPAAQREHLRAYLAEWQNGALWPPHLPTYRGTRLEMAWTGYEVHIDDTVWPDPDAGPTSGADAPIELSVRRNALRFLVAQ
ncbi:MAG TPA: diacylglycerol kinase family protein [Burkholderiales bacterium]|nr:diacylglycerol kinase family protein [Burkholderiales bacterium]